MHVTVVGTNFTLIHIWETTVNVEKIRDNLINSTFKICLYRQSFKANTEKITWLLIFNMFRRQKNLEVHDPSQTRPSLKEIASHNIKKYSLEMLSGKRPDAYQYMYTVPCVCCVCTPIQLWPCRVLSVFALFWRCRLKKGLGYSLSHLPPGLSKIPLQEPWAVMDIWPKELTLGLQVPSPLLEDRNYLVERR